MIGLFHVREKTAFNFVIKHDVNFKYIKYANRIAIHSQLLLLNEIDLFHGFFPSESQF